MKNVRSQTRFDVTKTKMRPWGRMPVSDAIVLAQAGEDLPTVWRDADNNHVPITMLSQLLAIARAIATQTQSAYAESWARKAALDAATTATEVEAV